jgi:hypothetical protein
MYPSPQFPSYKNYGKKFGLSLTQLYLKVFDERYAVFSWNTCPARPLVSSSTLNPRRGSEKPAR